MSTVRALRPKGRAEQREARQPGCNVTLRVVDLVVGRAGDLAPRGAQAMADSPIADRPFFLLTTTQTTTRPFRIKEKRENETIREENVRIKNKPSDQKL